MSSLSRNQMIKNLNEIVVPTLRQLNFNGSFPHFRRITPDRINLLTFQFDSYGGGFVIELANCNSKGYETALGSQTSPNKLTAQDFNKRKRIQSNMKTPNSSTDDWFRYDKKYLFGFGDIFKKVCKDVLSKLEVTEDYWKNGELN